MDALVDLLNPSDVHFFAAIRPELEKRGRVEFRWRDRSEVLSLCEQHRLPGKPLGKDQGATLSKVGGLAVRPFRLAMQGKFTHWLGFENPAIGLAARLRRGRAIQFIDNDLKFKVDSFTQAAENRLRMDTDVVVAPAACPVPPGRSKVVHYGGYKEDVYMAALQPDRSAIAEVPFEEYVVLRGEAMDARYVGQVASLVPAVLDGLLARGLDVVYLPRAGERRPAVERKGLFVPQRGLDGRNLVWFSSAVATGSGSFAREAARVGVPSVSFFPHELLGVDRSLAEAGAIHHSRDAAGIVEHLAAAAARGSKPDQAIARRGAQAFYVALGDALA